MGKLEGWKNGGDYDQICLCPTTGEVRLDGRPGDFVYEKPSIKAARIAELEAEIARLREALEECKLFVYQVEGRAGEAACDHMHEVIDAALRGEGE